MHYIINKTQVEFICIFVSVLHICTLSGKKRILLFFLLLEIILKTRKTSPFVTYGVGIPIYKISVFKMRFWIICMDTFWNRFFIYCLRKPAQYQILFFIILRCISVCLCVWLSLSVSWQCALSFYHPTAGKMENYFPRGGGCDLNYFRLSITSRTTTTSVFIRMLSVWACKCVSILVIAWSIFNTLRHFPTSSTERQGLVVSVSLLKIDGAKKKLCACVRVCVGRLSRRLWLPAVMLHTQAMLSLVITNHSDRGWRTACWQGE